MVLLELSGLTKRFGAVTAVDRADLAVHDGELLAVVGESGSGKTTMLRLIAGLETPDAGAVRIGGVPVDGVPPGRRNVQMIFQNFALWPHMKVFDQRRYTNLTLPLKVRRWSDEKIRDFIRPLAERLGIDERLYGRKPGALSGGEQQRVALGRAMASQPRVLLMDEPLSNIDPPSRLKMRGEILKFHRDNRLTTLYVTHHLADALALADRVAVMRAGRFEQVDTAENCMRRPATEYVADFFRASELRPRAAPGQGP